MYVIFNQYTSNTNNSTNVEKKPLRNTKMYHINQIYQQKNSKATLQQLRLEPVRYLILDHLRL